MSQCKRRELFAAGETVAAMANRHVALISAQCRVLYFGRHGRLLRRLSNPSKENVNMDVATITGFPYEIPDCAGCGKPLAIENAWMADGCPCNGKLGCNNNNETRWRLLMELQQGQALALERARKALHDLLQCRDVSWDTGGGHDWKFAVDAAIEVLA